ncbi:MAG: carbon storage regulator CsrA [Desulfocucumaceae bacterium]
MLVLARKKGQSIMIGRDIRIMIVDTGGETVRLGIEAPPGVEIFRTEIYRALQEENSEAVTSAEDVMKMLAPKMDMTDIKNYQEP